MRIISYNVNGIRSAIKKGLLEWLEQAQADIVCIQETKATQNDVNIAAIEALGYNTYWFSAQKKGYSGVAIFTKIKPQTVTYGNSQPQSDFEGRTIELHFENFTLVNAYFPSGTSGEERQTYKYQWLTEFNDYCNMLKKKHPHLIVCGDYNIAHKEIDIHNPKGNQTTSGFLPKEREWMDAFLKEDMIDAFRIKNTEPHQYSWWSVRFPSVRLENKGWRIDYITISAPLAPHLKAAALIPEAKHSDHCPVQIDIAI